MTRRFLSPFLFLSLFLSGDASAQKQLHDILSNLPFTMPELREPQFRPDTISIVKFGALPDGTTKNTRAFTDAIAACASAGGGTVVTPPGTWLTGPIQLKSNVNLHLEKGALVQFSKETADFPFIPGLDGTSKRYVITPPISAYRATNIAITGEGTFDGAGEVWRYAKKIDMNEPQWKALVASGGVVTADGKQWWPSKEALEGENYLKERDAKNGKLTKEDFMHTKEYLRPNLVELEECENVLLDGPTFENSPKHNILPSQCENVIIRNIKVLAPEYGQNTDGINPRSSRNVVIYNCTVDVGDDGICLKPSSLGEKQAPGPACQNIIVADCNVYKAHGGFVIGSESFGGVRNILVRNCIFTGTDVGLRFKSLRGRGGIVEKVYVENIQMRGIRTDAILFDMYYTGGAPEAEAVKNLTIRKPEPLTPLTPQFRDFSVKNVVCNGADRALVINGLPETTIKNMTLDSVRIASLRGATIADADGVMLNRCRIVPQSGPVFTIIDSRNVTISGGSYHLPEGLFMKVIGEKSENISVMGVDLAGMKEVVELSRGVKTNAVTIK